MRFSALALAVLFVVTVPAYAGETPWQEVTPGVQLRLVSTGVVKPDGKALFGLEIDMPENTKTYWRVPGETGFPTELDFSKSRGVSDGRIVWPHPIVDLSSGYLDFAYFGPTLLPIEVSVTDKSGEVELSALLGICSDICIPAQASFELPVADAAPDRPNGLRIKQALAEAPIPWTDGTAPIGKVEFLREENTLAVSLASEDIDPGSIIVATDSGEPLFGMPQKSPQAYLVLLPILAKTENIDLTGQDVQLSFMTSMGAFELRRTVGAEPANE